MVAFYAPGPLGDAAAAACRELGATTPEFDPEAPEGAIDTLVVDAAGRFAGAPQEGLAPLRAAADDAWVAVRAAGTATLIPAPEGGKIVLLAPGPEAGPHAGAARDAFENMARTLSIEWAQHEIRVTAVLPGAASTPEDVASLVVYLASPAGDYFSGCAFSMG